MLLLVVIRFGYSGEERMGEERMGEERMADCNGMALCPSNGAFCPLNGTSSTSSIV